LEEPWRAETDGHEDLDGHTYKWNVGDYLCRAAWLEKLEDSRNWYTRDRTRRKCIVNLDKVVNAKLDMRPFTDQEGDNPLPPKVSRTIVRRDGAWCMSDNDYVFLLEETQLREDNCEYDIGQANTILQMQREEQQWVNTNTDEVEGGGM
jgi:hypothetical protein